MPLTEKLIVQSIRKASYRRARRGVLGIGDDCAVIKLPSGHEALVTTDFSLEDVHFRMSWHPADSVGHRCLARGLSDIAAMGGTPRAAFLSLALPESLAQRWITAFLRGLLHLADRYQVLLAGGDTAQSQAGILADIVVLGSVPAGKAVLRSGARPGDLVYVSGTLGSSVGALNQLRKGRKLRPLSHPRHFYPEPRIALGRFLRERSLVSAMIDISDGLSTDLGHICDESKTGAIVYAHSLPGAGGPGALARALHGGEEYELLFTARPDRRIPKEIVGVPISLIGEIVTGNGMKLANPDGKTEVLKPGGWQHFS